jgi:type IV pilus assembly protein PilM
MFSMFAKKSLLGLDIGSSSVKIVELEPSGSSYRLRRFGYAPVPSEAIVQGSFMNATGISEAIQQAYEGGGFKTKDVATSVSGHAVIVKRISLPSQSADELDETIKWEAEQYIPFDIAEVNIDYQVLQDDALDGQMDVVLVAAKKDLIDDYLNVISDAGLNMATMDVDAFALGNMYELNYDPSPESAVALVDIGASVININVMNGAVPVFTRDITSGGNQYTEEIQKALSISFDEAERIKIGNTGGEVSTDVVPQEVEDAMREVSETLLGEVQRSLDFYRATSSSTPIDKVVLCGGSARVPGLMRLFEERVEVPFEVADPFTKINASSANVDEESLRGLSPALSVAMGLGMRSQNES